MRNIKSLALLCQFAHSDKTHTTSYFYFIALRLLLLVLIVTCLQGCVSTRHTGTTHCPPYLKDGDKILVNALSSADWKHQVQLIWKELKDRNVEVLYTPEEEYDLRKAGVINPLDSGFYKHLLAMGITHLLIIREVDSKRGDLWIYRTPHESSVEFNPYYPEKGISDENSYRSEIAMQLLALDTKQLYSFITKTQVNDVNVRDKQGGNNNINASGAGHARNIAIKKGAQRIAAYCR